MPRASPCDDLSRCSQSINLGWTESGWAYRRCYDRDEQRHERRESPSGGRTVSYRPSRSTPSSTHRRRRHRPRTQATTKSTSSVSAPRRRPAQAQTPKSATTVTASEPSRGGVSRAYVDEKDPRSKRGLPSRYVAQGSPASGFPKVRM